MITYPVNVATDRFTFQLRGNTRREQQWIHRSGEALVGADPALVIMQEIMVADPAFDPATHRLGAVVWVDNPGDQSTVGTREVVALTADEIAAAEERAAIDAELELVKSIYQDLKKGEGTAANRLGRLEKVAARLLRDSYTMPDS